MQVVGHCGLICRGHLEVHHQNADADTAGKTQAHDAVTAFNGAAIPCPCERYRNSGGGEIPQVGNGNFNFADRNPTLGGERKCA